MGEIKTTCISNQLLFFARRQIAAIDHRLLRILEVQVGGMIEEQVYIGQRRELFDGYARVNIEFLNAALRKRNENMLVIQPDSIIRATGGYSSNITSTLLQLESRVDDLALSGEMIEHIFAIRRHPFILRFSSNLVSWHHLLSRSTCGINVCL